MSSADFRAFTQAELEEQERLANVYQGMELDLGPPAEHFSIDHLEQLLAMPLSLDLRSLYLSEYSDLRAGIRALAITGLDRKDFYDDASQTALRERVFLATTAARQEFLAAQYKKNLDGDSLATLSDLQDEYDSRKSESEQRLQVEGDLNAEAALTDSDIVRVAMKEVDGVSSRGVSTSKKRTI